MGHLYWCGGSIKIANCVHSVEKMTSEIKGWQGQKLSYAGRLQLVNSVLMSITHTGVKSLSFPKNDKGCKYDQ